MPSLLPALRPLASPSQRAFFRGFRSAIPGRAWSCRAAGPCWAAGLCLATGLCLVDALPAAAPGVKYVVTDPAKVDEDHAWQGEYFGPLEASSSALLAGRTVFGLQVVALGDGYFQAALHEGGLPGAGWNRRTKTVLKGQRLYGELKLEGPQRKVIVKDQRARLLAADETELCVLTKIRRASPTLNAPAPADALMLFDEKAPTRLDHLSGAKVDELGYLRSGCVTKANVGDFRLHLEFRAPYQPHERGQARGNSGVYIQRRYEVQILDSFGLDGVANECGALYRQQPPAVNMALPPLEWQTYDIHFRAARFAEGRKTAGARVTVLHNGEPVHDNREIANKTGAGQAEAAHELPILLQDHGDPVAFRNVWIVLGDGAQPRETPGWRPPLECHLPTAPEANPLRFEVEPTLLRIE